MAAESKSDRTPADEAFRRFLQRCWKDDIGPLLRDAQPRTRATSARIGGKLAAATGLAVDSLFHLKGRPFSRAFAVLGGSAGAMLPDLWDWSWIRRAGREVRETAEARLRLAAERLEDDEALALFGLSDAASAEDLRSAWRTVALRWHPDRAPDDEARIEYHLRFVAYQGAHRRLCEAYEQQRLPRRTAT